MSGIGKAVVKAVLHSVHTPGLQSWILPTLNTIMALLFTTVFYCIYWEIGGWYMYVMAMLAAGLSFSSNMALAEILAIQKAQGRQDEIDGISRPEQERVIDSKREEAEADADTPIPGDEAARDTPQAASASRKLNKRRKEL